MFPSPAIQAALGTGPILRPTDQTELRAVVAREKAVFPVGGATMIDWGRRPTVPGTILDLTGLSRVIDYPARDMTITVEAGITIAELQRLLATEKQQLAVDVPRPERATLGGAIAVNASGPRRFGLGTLRDYVIGIRFLSDSGQEINGGGRVVKNVAGYDLCKLQIGAFGTLGIVTQLTLKLKPLPEAGAWFALAVTGNELAGVLDTLHASQTRPTAVDALSTSAALTALPGVPAERDFVVVVGFEDNAQAVAWQGEQLRRELATGLRDRLCEAPADTCRRLSDFLLLPTAVLSFKANLRASRVAGFLRTASTLPVAPSLLAHAGSGIVYGHWSAGLAGEEAARLLQVLRTEARSADGNLVLPHCPEEWKADFPIWGDPTSDQALMAKIKATVDPGLRFNPGRFLPGF